MPYKLNSRDVLVYLNSLGYTDINAQQLKEFMHDLKKLIKYEQKRQKDENQNSSVRQTVDDIFENLYQHSTLESRAKQVPVKDKAVHVKIVPKPREHHCDCVHHEQKIKTSSPKLQTDKSLVDKDTQTEIYEIPSVSSKVTPTKKKSSRKPSTQVIKTTSCTSCKSDPVALYHQYQEEWKRIKIPGQDSRADLRWSIRQKMMGSRDKCCRY